MFSFAKCSFVALLCFATLHYTHCRDDDDEEERFRENARTAVGLGLAAIIGIVVGSICLVACCCALICRFLCGCCQRDRIISNTVVTTNNPQPQQPVYVVNQQQQYMPLQQQQQQQQFSPPQQQQFVHGQQPQFNPYENAPAMGGKPYAPPPEYPGSDGVNRVV